MKPAWRTTRPSVLRLFDLPARVLTYPGPVPMHWIGTAPAHRLFRPSCGELGENGLMVAGGGP
jgi:hypothetical protein